MKNAYHLLALVLLSFSTSLHLHSAEQTEAAPSRPTSILVILTDDQGYGDLSSYGSRDIATPHIDQLAAEGAKFTDAYAAPVCTPSRAALLTGSHPLRVDIKRVVWTQADRFGLNPSEVTTAEVLKEAGYHTASIGKWHLGNYAETLPTNQGFAEFFGTPSGHNHGRVGFYQRLQYPDRRQPPKEEPLRLYDGLEVVELEPAPDTLTKRFSERAEQIIRNTPVDKAFYILLAHPMPHHPVVASKQFIGTSKRGTLFGDSVQEIDHYVGKLMTALQESGRHDDTLVVFASDNGPTKGYSEHETGDAGGLRGWKGSTWEGGARVPLIMRLPNKIPAGQLIREPVMLADLHPTSAALAGATLPEVKIDGKNLLPLLTGEGTWEGHEEIVLARGKRPESIRIGKWKFREVTTKDDHGEAQTTTYLFDLERDPGEHFNMATQDPERVTSMRQQLADWTARILSEQRPSYAAEEGSAIPGL